MTLSPYSQRRWAVGREMPNCQQIGFHSLPVTRAQTSLPSSGSSQRSQSIASSASVMARGDGLPEALERATDGGRLPAMVRQVYYAARPALLELTGLEQIGYAVSRIQRGDPPPSRAELERHVRERFPGGVSDDELVDALTESELMFQFPDHPLHEFVAYRRQVHAEIEAAEAGV